LKILERKTPFPCGLITAPRGTAFFVVEFLKKMIFQEKCQINYAVLS